MKVQLHETAWDIGDEAEWTTGWVGFSTGDIYVDDKPWGWYRAAWYPNTDRPAQLVLNACNEALRCVMSVAFQCRPGDPASLVPVGADGVPWGPDGILVIDYIEPGEIAGFSRAVEACEIARDVIRLDDGLRKYIVAPDERLMFDGKPIRDRVVDEDDEDN